MTKSQTKSLLLAIASFYPGFECSRETIEAWYFMLAGVSFDAARLALLDYASKNNPFPPSVGQLVDAARRNVAAALPVKAVAMTDDARERDFAALRKAGLVVCYEQRPDGRWVGHICRADEAVEVGKLRVGGVTYPKYIRRTDYHAMGMCEMSP